MLEIKLEKVEIPPKGLHLLLEVKLDNETVNLVLDTGASRSVIDKAFFERLDPTVELAEESSFSAGVGSSDLLSYTAIVKEMRIGSLVLQNYEVAVMDLQHVILSYEQIDKGPVYGVIGGDLLEEYRAVIDYSKLTLILSK